MGFPIIEGFDIYASTSSTTGLLALWSNQSGGGGPSLAAGRFGGQCLTMTDGTGATSFLRRQYSTPHSDFSIGFAAKDNSAGSYSNQQILRIESATGTQMSIYVEETTGIVRLYRGLGTTILLQSAAAVFTKNIWNYIRVYGKIDQTVGWAEMYVGTTFVGRFDGDTAALAGTTMDGILLCAPDRTGSGSQMQFDDLFVADDNVDYGQCRVETLRPVADTAQKQFVPSTVGTNFDDVDDVTFVVTDYVDGSNVNDYDLYELADLSSNPLAIHATKPIVCMAKTDAGPRQGATVLDSGGTQSTSGNIAVSNDPFIYEGNVRLTNPNGSIPWTQGAVNAVKLGPKVAA